MSKTLPEIAQQLVDTSKEDASRRDRPKKVLLIYAFNGTGKTRLSREFKQLVAPKEEGEEDNGLARDKILYYNAFTEDLFYWDTRENGDVPRVQEVEHLLPETSGGLPNPYAKRIVNFSSHSKHAAEEVPPLKPEEKTVLANLLSHIVREHRFWKESTP